MFLPPKKHRDPLELQEQRLLRFAGDGQSGGGGNTPENTTQNPDGAASADPEKAKREAARKWRELRRKENPKDQLQRIEKQIDNEENHQPEFLLKQMKEIIKRGDQEEIDWIDEYFNSGEDYDWRDFNDGLAQMRERRRREAEAEVPDVDSRKAEIAGKVIDISDYISQVPVRDGSDAKQKLNDAIAHNAVDKEKTEAMIDLALNQPGVKLTKKQWNEIFRTDPNQTESYNNVLKKIFGADFVRTNDKFIKEFTKLHKEKHTAMVLCEAAFLPIVAMLEEELPELRHQKLTKFRLGKETGLPIREGEEFDYTGPDGEKGVATIKAIGWEQALDPEEINKIRQRGDHAFKQIKLEVEIQTPNGTTTEAMGYRSFLDWANKHAKVQEFIPNVSKLKERLELDQFDQTLQIGDQIDYRASSDDDGRKIQSGHVSIASIDDDAGTITLSEPVQLFQAEGDGAGEAPTKQTMSLGEFARWWRRWSAEKSMSLEEAQAALNKLPSYLKRKYPDQANEINELPIKLEPGFEIKNGPNKGVKIVEATPEVIRFSNDEEMSPAQFVRQAKDYELEPLNWPEAKEKEPKPAPEEIKPPEIPKEPGEIPPTPADDDDEEDEDEDDTQAPVTPDKADDSMLSSSPGFFRDIWNNIEFLSLADVGRFGEVISDFMTRNHERNSKRRVGIVGSSLPGRLGREYQIMQQESEEEAVNKYKGGMTELSDWQVSDRLYSTNNQDEAKACLIMLTERGVLRFDDVKMWRTINRILDRVSGGSDYKINVRKFKGSPDEAQDQVKTAMDFIWGESTGNNWYKQNLGQFDSESSSYEAEARDYENGFKGVSVEGELHNMLLAHVDGKPVKPHRYFSFIKFIMEQGKSAVEDKFYYLLMGLVVENARGETLLPSRIIGTINTLSNQLPWLDFLTKCYPIEGKGNLPKEYLQELLDHFGLEPNYNENSSSNRYNVKAINQFIWQDALMFNRTITRVSKGSRISANMDHDDSHFIIPLTNAGDMINNVLGTMAGTKLNFTRDGYKNGVAGFSQMFVAASAVGASYEEDGIARESKNFMSGDKMIARMIPSYVYYMNSLTNKMKKDSAKQGADFLDDHSALDPKDQTIRKHFEQMNSIIREVLEAYGFPQDKINIYLDLTFGDRSSDGFNDRAAIIENFNTEFIAAVGSNTRPLMEIFRKRSKELPGASGTSSMVAERKTFGNYWRSGYGLRLAA